jgi:hypothetical protein
MPSEIDIARPPHERIPSLDYDMDSYVSKYGYPDQSGGKHLTDEFKYPHHITFSDESIYSTPEKMGGRWRKHGDIWHFYASPFNIKERVIDDLQKYFKQYEPGSILHLPTVERVQ